MGLHVKDEAFTGAKVLESAHKQATESMEILDAHLTKSGAYIAGDGLTIADCSLGMFVHRWFALPMEREEFAALAAYYERLKTRAPFHKWIVGQGV